MVRTAVALEFAVLLLPAIHAVSIDRTKFSLFRRDKTTHLPNLNILTAEPDRIPPAAKSTTRRWDAGLYPQSCYDKAREAINDSDARPKCQLRDLEVYDVTYEGCDADPWIMCRCVNAEHSLQEMVDGMGTVPHGIRSMVSHVVNMNGFGGGGGGSNNDRIYYGGRPEETFFSHESMHSNDKGFSISEEYQKAYDADSCVPDDYANASPAENFAQLGTWLNFGINGKEIDPYVGTSASCMTNQLQAAQKWLGDKLPLATTKCAPRPANDANVAAKRKAREVVKADPVADFESLLPHVPYDHDF
ncbi:hypothetical protein K504DRAFT_492964 [Pleomassaria siparia CBS 279.74]|uniref:Uncharacterized protein n=1 Tax=Pleomassaria siparia CBS 279.74 TaxID=1314801 RepID=A0A6G1K117_9PLEO|nr:hypothetical protein K504DRAFT_492964 [Pleomassaria siparia CBS 279.74]